MSFNIQSWMIIQKWACGLMATMYHLTCITNIRAPTANLRPNYYVAVGAKPDTLDLWKFKVDWKDPRKSSFGQVSNNAPNATIPVAHYNLACNGSGATCVTQPQKVKGQEQLDSLGDRLMFRLPYHHSTPPTSPPFTH